MQSDKTITKNIKFLLFFRFFKNFFKFFAKNSAFPERGMLFSRLCLWRKATTIYKGCLIFYRLPLYFFSRLWYNCPIVNRAGVRRLLVFKRKQMKMNFMEGACSVI